MMRRTSAIGNSAGKNSRAEFFSTCCVSVSPNCMSVALGESEDEVAEDEALNFRRARFNRIPAGAQVAVGPLAFVDDIRRALRELSVLAEHFLRDLVEALVELAPEDFLDGPFRPRHAALIDAAVGAHLIEAHDFDFGVTLGELLADDRIGGASELPREFQQPVE